jgi:NAD(P)-dependent dehydrogenase (short-subunit alcohol dehydrogenase family)
VWLVTGCSSGLGRAIAELALAKGRRVAVTARRPESVADIAAAHPDRALVLALDVTDRSQIERVVGETEAAFGAVDVLVNNAGYGYMAAVEEGEDEEVRALFDTNYFGAVDLVKAVLPGMRRRRRGFIVNVSSMAGLVTNPPNVYYSATKHALEALSEGLAKELAPFGIRVTAVEPGAFRTDYASRSIRESKRPLDAYAETVGARKALIRLAADKLPGDPRRAAEAVLMLSELEDPPRHLLLGRDVYAATREKLRDLAASIDEWKEVTLDVNLPGD